MGKSMVLSDQYRFAAMVLRLLEWQLPDDCLTLPVQACDLATEFEDKALLNSLFEKAEVRRYD